MKGDDGRRALRGTGWPARAAAVHPEPFGRFLELVRSRGAMTWFAGGALSLAWVVSVGSDLAHPQPAIGLAFAVLLLVVFGVVYLLAVPIVWALPARWRLVPAAVLMTYSFSLFPWIGWGVRGLWGYVGVLVAMAVVRWSTTWLILFGLAGAAWLPGALANGPEHADLFVPAIILSVSAVMAAFARNTAAMNELRSAQDQVAMMAAERERGRIARDLHDILGHSLTVITVKTELAGRLVESDPDRARQEIAEVESLARGALIDVRATVNASRAVSIAGELAAARQALEAAGIRRALPTAVDHVPNEHRELAGWIVREGVTNVRGTPVPGSAGSTWMRTASRSRTTAAGRSAPRAAVSPGSATGSRRPARG